MTLSPLSAETGRGSSPHLNSHATDLDQPRQRLAQRIGVAEVEGEGFVGRQHLLEETAFALVFDVAYCERANAQSVATRKRRAVHEQFQALDTGRRHGIDVGDDDQILGERLVFFRDHLHARCGGGKDDFGVGDDIALLVGGFAIDTCANVCKIIV